jgi:hypothetical protein
MMGRALLLNHLAEQQTMKMLAAALERALAAGEDIEATLTANAPALTRTLAQTSVDPAMEAQVLEIVTQVRAMVKSHGAAVLSPMRAILSELARLLAAAA